MNRKANGIKGFTLFELMAAVAIVTITTGMAIPKLLAQMGSAQRRSATHQFVSAHALTKATAIRYGTVAELHIDVSGSRYWIEVDTSYGSGVTDTVRMHDYSSEESLVMASNRYLVCFDGRGLPSTAGACQAANATVVFAESSQADTLKFTILGQVLR